MLTVTWQLGAIAFALMTQAETKTRQRNLPALTLSVRVALADQQQYYQRMGFRVIGHGIHDGFAAPTFLKMRKDLGI